MKRILSLLLTLCGFAMLCGQTIHLSFPHFAGAEYDFYLFRGEKTDTIQRGKIGADGNLKLIIPERHKGYAGMSRWLLKGGGGLDFVINGEDFSVSCTEAQPSDKSIVYAHTRENTYLAPRYLRQQAILGKLDALTMVANAYPEDSAATSTGKQETDSEALRSLVAEETKKQQASYNLLQSETETSPLHAARFAEIVDLTRGFPPVMSREREENEQRMKDFIINRMDIEVLYTSGHWYSLWDQWFSWYTAEENKHQAEFLEDVKLLLSRTRSEEVYAALVEQVIGACERQGWHGQEMELAYFLQNEGRILQPEGRIAKLFTLFKVRNGMKAPLLTQTTLPAGKKTLLVFHETGCSACEKELQKLKTRYDSLKAKGYEVVSLSADVDERIFRDTAAQFPWTGKHCDLKGFDGADFQNYGVMGTPTFFVIDKQGVVCGRYAWLKEMDGCKK